MKRKIYNKLLEWKNSPYRKPLIVQGSRQIGKTYIILEFGKNEFQNTVYINLENDKELMPYFSNCNIDQIIEAMQKKVDFPIDPKNTLIIVDEIQACPEAITSLKYFNEQRKDLYIIASGSLIGLTCHREQFSFPVGQVDFLDMYPMDFEEFLMACNDQNLIKAIKLGYEKFQPLNKQLHELALNRYKEYLFVGGMPEAVSLYVDTKNSNLVRDKQNWIIKSYINDMTKYNSNIESIKTIDVYQSITKQLAKENKKFKYSLIKDNARSKEYEWCIRWLCVSGISNQVFKLNSVQFPFDCYCSQSDFKIYDSDIGLCCANHKIRFSDIMNDNPIMWNFKGGMTENYVFTQLKMNNFELYYWTNKYDAEVDFVTRIGDDIIPIEVKSNVHVISKSLLSYINENKPKYCIRLSTKNFGYDNGIKSIPLYAVFCLKN